MFEVNLVRYEDSIFVMDARVFIKQETGMGRNSLFRFQEKGGTGDNGRDFREQWNSTVLHPRGR